MKVKFLAFVVSATVIAAAVTPGYAQPQDAPWPMFHHDMRHTGLSLHEGPDEPVLKWTYETGSLTRDPVIDADGTV